MKRLAARDFEDLLQASEKSSLQLNLTHWTIQCAIPVFEGLLPDQHNNIMLDLLFDLATWHTFAKLRLHTKQTLELFDAATNYLGCSIHKFERTTCRYYHTTELPQEHAVRGRRTAALSAKQGHAIPPATSRPKQKKLNLHTYKFHALGDYVDTIQMFGTMDNYMTQTVSTWSASFFLLLDGCQGELEHHRVKRRFPRSGKKKEHTVKSIANQDTIERFVRKVDNTRRNLSLQRQPESQPRRTHTSPSDHYSIAQTSRKIDSLTSWLRRHTNNPAFVVSLHCLSLTLLTNLQDFLPRLKDHLLARARGLTYDGDEHTFSNSDRGCVNIKDDRIYHHSLLRVNYTTYDLRREQDTINPLTRADIMVLSH